MLSELRRITVSGGTGLRGDEKSSDTKQGNFETAQNLLIRCLREDEERERIIDYWGKG